MNASWLISIPLYTCRFIRPIAFVGAVAGELRDGRVELRWRHGRGHHPRCRGLRACVRRPKDEELERPRQANRSRLEPCAAGDGVHATFEHALVANLRIFRAHPEVAGHRDVQPNAEREPVEGRDRGLRHAPQRRLERGVRNRGLRHECEALWELAHPAELIAGTEPLSRSPEYHHPHSLIARADLYAMEQFGQHGLRDRVAPFRPVEGQFDYSLVSLPHDLRHGLRVRSHLPLPVLEARPHRARFPQGGNFGRTEAVLHEDRVSMCIEERRGRAGHDRGDIHAERRRK